MLTGVRSWADGRRGLGWLVVAVDLQVRFSELRGNLVAAGITLMAFLSLFPLLVVGVAVLGFASAGSADLPGRVIDALGLPPGDATAEQIRSTVATAEDSRRVASVVGLAGLAWSGLGLVGALEQAHAVSWRTGGRGLKGRLTAIVWLAGAGVLFAASFAATALLNLLPAAATPAGVVVGAGLAFFLFLWSGRVLTGADVGWRAFVPGAILGAAGFELLKLVGSIYVPRAVASASALYGTIGIVFALLAWLFVFGRLWVYSALLNPILWNRHHPTASTSSPPP